MNKRTCLSILLLFATLFSISVETRGQYYLSKRKVTRGGDTAEIYINCLWYYDINGIPWNGLFYSNDNGLTLTIKRKKCWWEEGGIIHGDSIVGRIFQLPMQMSPDTFGISYNYGTDFDLQYFNQIYYSAAGCLAGEIYIQASELGMGIYRSDDYGDSFTWQIFGDSLRLRDVGTLPGELYCYIYTAMTGPLGLAYSNDYGQSFSTSCLEFPGVPGFDECMIYRGTEPGEIYFVLWLLNAEIYLFHTFDYGQTITFQGQLPYPDEQDLYTAGRTPGTFYAVQRQFVYDHSVLYIYFSRDYGVNYTLYVHDLDSTYTNIPSYTHPENSITCFPNPATDQLTVSFSPYNVYKLNIQLFDLTERLQYTTTIPPGQKKTEIDVSSLNHGIYLLKVTDGNKVIGVKKVIVQ